MGFIGDDKSISSNTNILMVIAYFLCKVCLKFLYYVKLHILYIFIHSLENNFPNLSTYSGYVALTKN